MASTYDVNFMPNAQVFTKALEKSKAHWGRCVGESHYKQMLSQVRAETPELVGVNPHMLRPTPAGSRLGYKGKRPSNKTMQELGLNI